MDRFVQDLRFGVRALRRSPLFTLTVLVTLAIGIGANTAIFSFVDALLLRPLPYAAPERIVTLWQDYSARGGPEREWFTPPDFEDVRAQAASFSAVTMVSGFNANLTGSGEPQRLAGGTVSPGWFDVVGVAPALGRGFTEEDADDGLVVVLSHELWQTAFGGAAAILGRTVQLNGIGHTVIGVMPAGFEPPLAAAQLWRPYTATTFGPGCMRSRGCFVMQAMARVAPGATAQQVDTELATLTRAIGESDAEKAGLQLRAVPLRELITGPSKPALLVLLSAVGLLLLIACVSIANLLLARAGTREREIAVRAALGAGRGRIVRQLLTETLTLGIIGGVLGVLVAVWGVQVLVGMTPPGTPLVSQVRLDTRVLAFAALLSVTTGLLFGLAPALQLSRTGMTGALRDGQRTTGTRRRLRSALVVAELALALMLLVGAGLLVRSFARLQAVDPGFRPENTLSVALLLPQTTYQQPANFNAFYSTLLERLAGRPGVTAAGASSIIPLSGTNSDMSFIVEGRPLPDPGQVPAAWYRSVTPGYFDAIGMRLLRGRGITAGDRAGAPLAVVINETLAARHWPASDPLGQRISWESDDGPWATVVGVVADSRHTGMDAPPLAEMYLSVEQLPARAMTLVLRTAGDPVDLVPTVRAEVRALDPQLPLGAIGTLEDAVRASTALPRLYLSFFAFFAAVAVVLAAVGIYGVTSYTVTQRTREIGIRMALGAREGDVLSLVLRHALAVAAAGVGIGVIAALALSRTLASLLYDLSPTDPVTFAIVALSMAAVAIVATAVPALRAARVDPIVALRND